MPVLAYPVHLFGDVQPEFIGYGFSVFIKKINDLIEAYKYMGSYYAITENNLTKGKEYFQKVLALSPDDAQAKEVLESIRQGAIQNARKDG